MWSFPQFFGTEGRWRLDGLVRGVESSAQSAQLDMNGALKDLDALMVKAREMVRLAGELNDRLTAVAELRIIWRSGTGNGDFRTHITGTTWSTNDGCTGHSGYGARREAMVRATCARTCHYAAKFRWEERRSWHHPSRRSLRRME